MSVDFLFEHTQLIAHSNELMKKHIQGDFLGLQRRIGWVKDHFAFVPSRPQLLDDCVRFLITQAVDDGFDGRLNKLLEGSLQPGNRHTRFSGSDAAQLRINRAHRVVEPDLGRLLCDGFYRSQSVLRVADTQAHVQRINFHGGEISRCFHKDEHVHEVGSAYFEPNGKRGGLRLPLTWWEEPFSVRRMSRLPFELLLAVRYLRPKRTFVSVITLISVLGVTLGVAVLIIVISVMSGFDHDLRDKILGFNPQLRIMKRAGTLHDYQAVMRLVSSNSMVRAVAPYVLGRVMVETQPQNGQSQFDAPVLRGLDPELETNITTIASNIVDGKFDVSGRGLLIGSEFAHNMSLQVGDRISVYSPQELQKMRRSQGKETVLPDEFEVRGIFDVGYFEYDAQVIMSSLEEAQDLYVLDSSVHGLMVELHDPYRATAVANQLAAKLGPAFQVTTWMQENASLLGALVVEKNVMFYLLFFIMIVAALCILSALITFVVQKTREIGMLKALGATDLQVSGLFLSQSGFVGAVGVVAGFCLGRILLAYRNEFLAFMNHLTGFELFPAAIYGFNKLPALIVPGDILIICGSALLICLLGGLIPAWRAGRLRPVEALRYE